MFKKYFRLKIAAKSLEFEDLIFVVKNYIICIKFWYILFFKKKDGQAGDTEVSNRCFCRVDVVAIFFFKIIKVQQSFFFFLSMEKALNFRLKKVSILDMVKFHFSSVLKFTLIMVTSK